MIPTETLAYEHTLILMVLDTAEGEVRAIGNTGKIHVAEVEKLIDFLANFVDRCHHSKEERLLFPKMQERGMLGEGGLIVLLLEEHTEGRRRVEAISKALPLARKGEIIAVTAVRTDLRAYVELMRPHIANENDALFPMTDRILTTEDQQALTDAFEKLEAEEIGEGVHERYHHLAHELTKGTT